MPRAFVLLNRERRHDHETRRRILAGEEVRLNGEDTPKRIIPVQYSDDPRPLVTTAAKVIGGLIAYTTSVVVVVMWLMSNRYEHIITEKLYGFQLAIAETISKAKDAVPRPEYELRHTELIERDRQWADRVMELEKRVRDLEKNGKR